MRSYRPTRKQKMLIDRLRLNPDLYNVIREDDKQIQLLNKLTGAVVIRLKKEARK